MKKLLMVFVLTAGSILFFTIIFSSNSNSQVTFQGTIADYPLDEKKQFITNTTSLQLLEQDDEDQYTIEWRTSSELKEKMDIRHDFSLLFEDGRLKETISITKENSNKLDQKLMISGEDSGHFEAISFHYGQIHYPNNITKSVQQMSFDQLYILDSPLSPIEYFKVPTTPSEIEGKRILDTIIEQNLHYHWQELIDYFQIPTDRYHSVPLTSLFIYNEQNLPNLSRDETKEILAEAWESIYHYYFQGLEKHNGEIVSSVDSSVPLLLFHKSYSHILFLFSGKGGEKYNVIRNVT